MYSQGDIILVPYPYTDLSSYKQRPVVVISKNHSKNGNYIVAKITSVIRRDEFSFLINPKKIDVDLRYESEVRTNELFTVNHNIVIKKFSSFDRGELKRLTERIKQNISVD